MNFQFSDPKRFPSLEAYVRREIEKLVAMVQDREVTSADSGQISAPPAVVIQQPPSLAESDFVILKKVVNQNLTVPTGQTLLLPRDVVVNSTLTLNGDCIVL